MLESHSTYSPAGGNVMVRRAIVPVSWLIVSLGAAWLPAQTPDERMRIARKLQEAFTQQDLEISCIAAGSENRTVVFTSEMFKEAPDRTTFMQMVRKQWEKQLCAVGFRRATLSASLFNNHDYDLRCPPTPSQLAALAQKRRDFAAGVDKDIKQQGLDWAIRVSGTGLDVLDITSPQLTPASFRSTAFGMMKKRLGAQLCDLAFTAVRFSVPGSQSETSRFALGCAR